MNAETSLEDLFQKWQILNENASDSFGAFDFSSIKKIREKQRKIEDLIYSILLENAPEDIKKILPDGCGEMEIGYNTIEKEFYFSLYRYTISRIPEHPGQSIQKYKRNVEGQIHHFEQVG